MGILEWVFGLDRGIIFDLEGRVMFPSQGVEASREGGSGDPTLPGDWERRGS
jgi:hypothetical protein